jgi:hypothetical protein
VLFLFWQAYYRQFKPIIGKEVDESQFHSQKLPVQSPQLLSTSGGGPKATLDETASDKCMSQVMGTDKNTRCAVTPHCLHMMTSSGTSSYFLTHQLLFFSLGQNFGCSDKLSQMVAKKTGKPLRSLVTEKCGRIYSEMKAEQKMGQQTSDIFLEQLYTCGAYGFTDFFHKEWLQATMQQQTKSGCFKQTGMGRRLLVERDVMTKDGCSIHKSSVASCLLSVFLQDFAAKADWAAKHKAAQLQHKANQEGEKQSESLDKAPRIH